MIAVTVLVLPLVVLVVALWLDGQPPSRGNSYRPRAAAIHDIERQTIQAMQRAEREARAHESIDGTVIEEDGR
jgi:hypothetical protein